jgi:hypothetical protein
MGVAACSSASPPRQLPVPRPAPTPVDAGLTAPSPALRGEACSSERPCDAALTCAPLAGGYCASSCETGCGEGACVETPRAGELCMKRCDADRECRVDEGYVCDRQWHACLLPNLAAIVPAVCPAVPGAHAQDTAFAPSQRWSGDALAAASQLEPSAVITDDGGVTALFRSRTSMVDSALGVSRIDGNGIAALEQPVSAGPAPQVEPWLARDREGVLYAAWLAGGAQAARRAIELATSNDRGATWSAPLAVNDPADCPEDTRDCLERPIVVSGPDPQKPAADIVYVMYATAVGGLRVRASRDRGKTFGPAVTALVGGHGNAAVDAKGTLHVATLNGGPRGAFGSAMQMVEYTSSATGGASFATPVRVSGFEETLPFYFANPAIAVDAARKRIYLAYVRGGRDATWEIVLAVSKDAGATWKRTKLAGDGCAIHMVPTLALDPKTGTLHVAYYDTEGATGRFVHASCAAGGVRCKVLGAINTVPFATLSTGRHGRTWIGDYESLVVDASRRTLHAVWAQVVDEAGAKVSRIFHSSAKLK